MWLTSGHPQNKILMDIFWFPLILFQMTQLSFKGSGRTLDRDIKPLDRAYDQWLDCFKTVGFFEPWEWKACEARAEKLLK